MAKHLKWRDHLALMPRLTENQATAIKDIVDRHLADMSFDYPKVDDAHFEIQRDIDALTGEK